VGCRSRQSNKPSISPTHTGAEAMDWQRVAHSSAFLQPRGLEIRQMSAHFAERLSLESSPPDRRSKATCRAASGWIGDAADALATRAAGRASALEIGWCESYRALHPAIPSRTSAAAEASHRHGRLFLREDLLAFVLMEPRGGRS
jgi:hypothetical protein